VTILLPNMADYFVPVMAAWRCGAAVSLVDPFQRPGEQLQSGGRSINCFYVAKFARIVQ
jgi:hypothetical protein